jgi:hypothetical protein
MGFFDRAKDIAGDVASAAGNVADAVIGAPARPFNIQNVAKRALQGGVMGGLNQGDFQRAQIRQPLPMAEYRQPINPNALRVQPTGGYSTTQTHPYGLDDWGREAHQSFDEYPGNFAETYNPQMTAPPMQPPTYNPQPALGVGALDYNGRLRVR